MHVLKTVVYVDVHDSCLLLFLMITSSIMASAYQRLMLKIASGLPERFRAAFLHSAGPTTVFFWAPTFKWGLVIAGIGDLKRPADTISLSQTASLMITGAIWSRYSLVITPKNYNLFSVNLFTCGTGAYNFVRGVLYQMEQGKSE